MLILIVTFCTVMAGTGEDPDIRTILDLGISMIWHFRNLEVGTF